MGDVSAFVFQILIFAVPVLFAITIHEAAHGYAARYFGDNTAASLGRITLNPLAHIDLVGTVVMPIALLVLTKGAFVFGYAKPVPVNFARLRNPKQDMLWVALAGPATNVVQAFIWAFVLVAVVKLGMPQEVFGKMALAGISVNLVLAALNLFFIPPLDGGRVLVSLLPIHLAVQFARLERYGFLIVIALLALGFLGQYWITPLVQLGYKLISTVVLGPFLS